MRRSHASRVRDTFAETAAVPPYDDQPMRGPRLCSVALLALACLAGERTARAEAPFDLEWSAPEGCPDRAQVVRRVEEIVGPHPRARRKVSARAWISSVANAAPRYRMELWLGEGAAARTMNGDDCARLAEAAALVIALDIDPDALSREDKPPEPAESPPPPPPEPAPRAPKRPARRPPATPAAPEEPRFEAGLGARVVVDAGSLPRPALGLGLVLDVARGPLAFELQGTGYFKRFTVDGPRQGAGGAYVALGTLGAMGCWRGLESALAWRACAGGEIGRESTRGVNIVRPGASAGLWSAFSAMLHVRAWPRLAMSPVAAVVIGHPLSAASVQIEGFGPVFQPSEVFFRLILGAEAKFF
jgi:hypothetical protein